MSAFGGGGGGGAESSSSSSSSSSSLSSSSGSTYSKSQNNPVAFAGFGSGLFTTGSSSSSSSSSKSSSKSSSSSSSSSSSTTRVPPSKHAVELPKMPDKKDMEPTVVAFVEKFVVDIPVILELEMVLPRVGKAVALYTKHMKTLTQEELIDTLSIYLESLPNLSYTEEFINFISPTRRDFSFPVYARRIKEGLNKVRDVAEVLTRLFCKDETILAKFFLDESVCTQILEAGEYSEGQIDFPALVNEYHRIILAITPVEHNSLLIAITERLCVLGAHQRVPIIEQMLRLFYSYDEVRFFFGRECWDKLQTISELRKFIQSRPKNNQFKKFATDIACRFKRDTTVLIKIFSEKL